MMKKVWLILLAVVLVFGLALLGCGSKSSGGSGEGEGEMEEVTLFDLETDPGIQALTLGTLTFNDSAASGNPIAPLNRAGGDGHVSFKAIAVG